MVIESVIELDPHGLNDKQNKLHEYEVEVRLTKVGLWVETPKHIKISTRRKGTTSSSQYITANEFGESENNVTQAKIFVFNRL